MGEFSGLSGSQRDSQQRDFYPQSHCGCGKVAAITIFEVQNKHTGEVRCGSASEFSHYGRDGNCTWQARDDFAVIRGIGRCSDCYLSEEAEKRLGVMDE